MRNQHQMKLSNVVEKFKAKQTSELQALRKRVQTGREEQKKQRQLDLERLLQRYQNVKSELESQQNIERIRAEKFMRCGPSHERTPPLESDSEYSRPGFPRNRDALLFFHGKMRRLALHLAKHFGWGNPQSFLTFGIPLAQLPHLGKCKPVDEHLDARAVTVRSQARGLWGREWYALSELSRRLRDWETTVARGRGVVVKGGGRGRQG